MSNEIAKQACAFFLGRLQAEVLRLRAVAFPGRDPGPLKWLNLVDGILETAFGYIKRAGLRATPSAESLQLVEDAESLGEIAYEALKYVAGADATQIPEQVVAPFQRWVARLEIAETIFFRAEHLPNYELARLDARNLGYLSSPSRRLVNAIANIQWPALRVTVPGQAMGMLPHFAVVAHELGHAIQDRIKPDFRPHQAALNSTLDRIRARIAPSQFGTAETLRLQSIIDNWTNELKADSVGYLLGGPAFYFALFGFLELAARSYGISPTHPPSDLRRELLFAKLDLGHPSFREVFNRNTGVVIERDTVSPHLPVCPTANVLFSELKGLRFDTVDAAICVELVPYAREMADPIFDATESYLRSHCPDVIYGVSSLDCDLRVHLDLLCALVPPIEYSDASTIRPTSLASILNVGWAALLTRLGSIAPGPGDAANPDARRMERLHDLLIKAVELAEARLLWEEHR